MTSERVRGPYKGGVMFFQERVQAVMDWMEAPIGSMPAKNGKKTLADITKELKSIAFDMYQYSLSLDQKITKKS